jgi:aryl-alcohol dehydrogenase-like predicted oxidoreductase
MKKRIIGNNLEVSAVGFGCMGLTHAFGDPLEMSEATNLIAQAVDMGYLLFDTAECYTGIKPDGTIAYNEEAVGVGLRPYRSKIILATKFGVSFGNNAMLLDSKPASIRKALDGSLKRLGTDYVDLYYQHRIDPEVEPEIVADAMAQLIKEGKIRAWGISEVDDEDYLRRAHSVCPVSAVQNIYSMIDRETESLFPVFEELGITMVAYTPLAKGFLSGTFSKNVKFQNVQDNRSGRFQFTSEGFDHYQSVLDLIHNIAEKKNATAAQISLAWMINKKPWIVPIPGTRNPSRMQENANASDIILSTSEIQALDEALNAMNLKNTADGWYSVRK